MSTLDLPYLPGHKSRAHRSDNARTRAILDDIDAAEIDRQCFECDRPARPGYLLCQHCADDKAATPLPLALRASVALRTAVRAFEARCGHVVLVLACRVHEAAQVAREAAEDLGRWEDDGGAL